MTNSIQKIEDRPGFQSVAVLEQHADSLTPEQLQAIPMIAHGTSMSRVADYLQIPYQTVLQWVRTDYKFRGALEEFRAHMHDYHTSMLNQTAMFAWDRVFEYLTQTFDEDDKDNRNLQAQMARFVIGELGLKGRSQPPNVQINMNNNSVEENSIDVIARRIVELRNPSADVDGDYRIAAPTLDKNTELNSIHTSVLVDAKDGVAENEFNISEDAPEYVYHPSATYGKLDYNTDSNKWLCHVCGASTADLVVHIRIEHDLSPARYKKMYGLPAETKFYHEKIQEVSSEEVEEVLEKVV